MAGVAQLYAVNGLLARRFTPAAVATCAALLCVYSLARDSYDAFYVPPILLSTSLLILFARSLSAGREPMVTRFARVLMRETGPAIESYTRTVTWVWTVFFALMLIESILLALFAPLPLWSLFTNVLNYLFIAGVFAVELTVRLIRFPQHSAARFVRRLWRADFRRLVESGKPS